MGKWLFELGHTEDGITLCEEAIRMNPDIEKPYFFLAEMMHEKEELRNRLEGELKKARDQFSKAKIENQKDLENQLKEKAMKQ